MLILGAAIAQDSKNKPTFYILALDFAGGRRIFFAF
jgi:hypothetical protein